MATSKCEIGPIVAYRWVQRLSFQLGQRVGSHLALTDFHPDDLERTLAYGFEPQMIAGL